MIESDNYCAGNKIPQQVETSQGDVTGHRSAVLLGWGTPIPWVAPTAVLHRSYGAFQRRNHPCPASTKQPERAPDDKIPQQVETSQGDFTGHRSAVLLGGGYLPCSVGCTHGCGPSHLRCSFMAQQRFSVTGDFWGDVSEETDYIFTKYRLVYIINFVDLWSK